MKYQLRRKKIGNFVNSFDWFKSETLGTEDIRDINFNYLININFSAYYCRHYLFNKLITVNIVAFKNEDLL